MKVKDIRQKSAAELQEFLEEKKTRRDELVQSLREKKAKNVKELAAVKKDIARILTLLHELTK